MTSSLERRVLDRIDREHIRALPKWFFVTKDISIGVLIIVLTIFSSVLSAMILAFWQRLEGGAPADFPYFFLFLSGGAVFGSYETFAHSFSFYKIVRPVRVLLFLTVSFFLGYVLFANGTVEHIEKRLQDTALYQKVVPEAIRFYEKQ